MHVGMDLSQFCEILSILLSDETTLERPHDARRGDAQRKGTTRFSKVYQSSNNQHRRK